MKIFIVIVLSFTAAVAQTTSGTGFVGGVIGPAPARAQVISGGWMSSSLAGMPGGAVTGAPYSAEQVTEQVQTLADGTRITQPGQKIKFYRDWQGRTRTERTFSLPPGARAAGLDAPSLIEIFDPVSSARYTLEPRNHTAHRMSFPAVPPPPPPPPNSGAAPGNRLPGVLPAIVPAPGVSASNDQTPHPQFSRESLGTQMIEGVLAEGSRMTVVYPAGTVGNDRPITTISETWTSPELKTVVLSKNSDPRNGDSTNRLTNISRSEPDPSLFQIPTDYEIIDSSPVPRK